MDQGSIRLLVFFSVLATMALLESLWPRRSRVLKRSERWLNNLSLSVVNTVVVKLLGPVAAMTVATYAYENNYGLLLNLPLSLPFYLQVGIGIILLDLAIYAQHVASHRIPFFWCFHKIHHADRDIDVTTGIRFHPIEIIISTAYKCFVILILGPVPIAVFLFEVVLNASAMFNHANFRIPLLLDKTVRFFMVTPDMHRVHHSTIKNETNSNYGFFLSFWDRLFKTYTHQPQEGHKNMQIGLDEYQSKEPAKLKWSLIEPFRLK